MGTIRGDHEGMHRKESDAGLDGRVCCDDMARRLDRDVVAHES